MIEAACLANLENNVRDPELRERLRPDVPRRVQAAHHLAQLLRRDPAPERRARHRADRAHRAGGRPHARRPAARARRAGARDRVQGRRVHAPDARDRPRRADARRGVDAAAERVPLDLDPGVPELLHAQRPERTGRQLLADRGRRAPVRATSCSSSTRLRDGDVPRDQRERRRRWTSSRPRAPRPRRTRCG